MIKRSLSFLLVLTMMLAVFSILPVSAAQADEDISTIGLSGKTIDFSGGKLSYESTNGHIVITGSENLSSEITIPDGTANAGIVGGGLVNSKLLVPSKLFREMKNCLLIEGLAKE